MARSADASEDLSARYDGESVRFSQTDSLGAPPGPLSAEAALGSGYDKRREGWLALPDLALDLTLTSRRTVVWSPLGWGGRPERCDVISQARPRGGRVRK